MTIERDTPSDTQPADTTTAAEGAADGSAPAADQPASGGFDRAAAFAEFSKSADAELAALDKSLAGGDAARGEKPHDDEEGDEPVPEIGGGIPLEQQPAKGAAPAAEAPAGEQPAPKDEKPAAAPKADTDSTAAPAKAGAEGKAAPPQKEASTDDTIASLPKEVQAAIRRTVREQVKHGVASELGRLRAKGATVANATVPDPSESQEAKQAAAEWATFEAQYPVVAKGVVAFMKKEGVATNDHKKLMKHVREQVAAAQQAEIEDEDAKAIAAIAEKHPDYEAILSDKHFAEWRAKQTATINALGKSRDVADSIRLLDLYRLDHPRAAPSGGQPAPQADASQGKQPPAADTTAAQVAARRQRQQEGARAPAEAGKSVSPAPNSSVADVSALRQQMYAKANKELARYDQ